MAASSTSSSASGSSAAVVVAGHALQHEWWMTRTNREAKCWGCGTAIGKWQLRLLVSKPTQRGYWRKSHLDARCVGELLAKNKDIKVPTSHDEVMVDVDPSKEPEHLEEIIREGKERLDMIIASCKA